MSYDKQPFFVPDDHSGGKRLFKNAKKYLLEQKP